VVIAAAALLPPTILLTKKIFDMPVANASARISNAYAFCANYECRTFCSILDKFPKFTLETDSCVLVKGLLARSLFNWRSRSGGKTGWVSEHRAYRQQNSAFMRSLQRDGSCSASKREVQTSRRRMKTTAT
jgi:hypothetical protein